MKTELYRLSTQVCPVAPGDAQQYTDELTGNALWFVIMMFGVALLISTGFVLAGKIGNSPRLVAVGVGGYVVTFLVAVAFLIFPGILSDMLGAGCIDLPTS